MLTPNLKQACVKQYNDLNILMIVLLLISITFLILISEKSEKFLVSVKHESLKFIHVH